MGTNDGGGLSDTDDADRTAWGASMEENKHGKAATSCVEEDRSGSTRQLSRRLQLGRRRLREEVKRRYPLYSLGRRAEGGHRDGGGGDVRGAHASRGVRQHTRSSSSKRDRCARATSEWVQAKAGKEAGNGEG